MDSRTLTFIIVAVALIFAVAGFVGDRATVTGVREGNERDRCAAVSDSPEEYARCVNEHTPEGNVAT